MAGILYYVSCSANSGSINEGWQVGSEKTYYFTKFIVHSDVKVPEASLGWLFMEMGQ